MTLKNIFTKENVKKLITGLILLVVGLFVGGTVSLTVTTNEDGETVIEYQSEIIQSGSIELAEEQQVAVIVEEDGTEVVTDDIVTVEAVDGGELPTECDNDVACALGEYIDTSSPQAFRNWTLNNCYNNIYGAQCVQLANIFWQNYAGRSISTCGTGAAKGIVNCVEQNAGDDFTFITDPTQLQPGDWLIFDSGQWGHIGMALGRPNNGYITLLGQNQGGGYCAGGGSATNIINISLSSFTGAYRPNSYIVEEPEAEAFATNTCETYTVKEGDTLGQIMLDCTGNLDWSDWTAINTYADQWVSSIVRDGQTVYEGWNSTSGVGLFAGDVIEFKGTP